MLTNTEILEDLVSIDGTPPPTIQTITDVVVDTIVWLNKKGYIIINSNEFAETTIFKTYLEQKLLDIVGQEDRS